MGVLDFLNTQKKKLLDLTELDERFGQATSNLRNSVRSLADSNTRSDLLKGLAYSANHPTQYSRDNNRSITRAIVETSPLKTGFGTGMGNYMRRATLANNPVSRAAIDMTQSVATGAENIAQGSVGGVRQAIQGKPILKPALQTLKGFGQVAGTTAYPIVPAISLANQLTPQNSRLRRTTTGLLRGVTQNQALSPETKSVNTTVPVVGEVDPFMAAGNMVGFIQNPQNRMLFKTTEKWLSPELGKATLGNVTKWLGRTGTRGSIEDIFLQYPEMPETSSLAEKARWVRDVAISGALSEIGGQMMFRGASQVLKSSANGLSSGLNKLGSWVNNIPASQLANIFDDLKSNKIRKSPLSPATKQFIATAGQQLRDAQGRFARNPAVKIAKQAQQFVLGNAKVTRNGDKFNITSKAPVSGRKTSTTVSSKIMQLALDKKAKLADLTPQMRQQVYDVRFKLGEEVNAAYGATAGLGFERDENGNLKPTYSPERGMIGVAGLLAGKNARGYGNAVKFSSLLDQKPRFEIDDSGAKLVKGNTPRWQKIVDKTKKLLEKDDWDGIKKLGEKKLPDVIDHPELFRQYPQLKDVKIKYLPNNYDPGTKRFNGGYAGAYNPDDKSISISNLYSGDKQKSIILHEIQHAIQQIEGFARGGSQRTVFADLVKKSGFGTLDNIRYSFDNVRSALEKGDFSAKIKDLQGEYSVSGTNELKKLHDELIFLMKNTSDVDAYKGYQRLSGELEARAVQRRMNMPQSERLATDPYTAEMKATTGTVDPKDYITKFDSGTQEMVQNKNGKLEWDGSGQNPEEVIKIAKKQIGTGPEIEKKSLKQHWKKFYADWVNALQPIEDLRNQAVKISGNLKNDPKVAITRFLGAGGKAELRQRQNVQPVIDELSKLGISNSDFDIFLKAQRDIELGSRVDPVYGSDPVMARKVIESLGRKYDVSKMEELANKLYSYQNKLLAETRDAGFLTQKSFEKITASNQKYVPFDRIMDDVDDFIGLPTRSLQQGSQPVSKIKGSKRKILSPLESVIANTYKMEAAIAKNRVAQSIASLKNVPGFENVIKEVKKSQTKGTISVWENGSKKYYQVPEDVVTAVKGLDEEQTNIVIEVLSAPARMLRQQATGRNIDFMIPNMFRDQFEASFNSKYGYRPFLDYFDGLRHWLNFKFKKSDDVVEEWINSGGSMFFENMEGRKAISQQISDAKQKRVTKQIYDWVVGGIDFIGDISEKPTRIGLYKRARKAGADTFESALDSREGTLDFARRGAKMKVANSIVPFLNVGVQGFDRFVRTWKNNPKTALLKTAIYGGTPALLVSMYNNLFHGEEYAQVPDFVKDNNWIFMDGGVDKEGNPTYISLPKSHWQQYVANPIENMVAGIYGSNPKSFSQVALATLSSAVPVIGEGDSISEIGISTIGSNLPQIFKPPIEAVSNYDFFRQDNIISPYLKDKPPEEQVKRSTNPEYRYLGGLMNQSPAKLQHLVEGYAPLAKQLTNFSETFNASARGDGLDINKIPVARRFRGSYSGFDIDRPEKKEDSEGFLSRLLKPTATTEASESVKIAVPEDKEQFKEIYKQYQSKATGFSEKVVKIRYNPTLSEKEKEQKIQELREDTLPWAENYIKIQDQHPEKVFEIELDMHDKDGGKSTSDRVEWVNTQLSKNTTDQEKKHLIETLYDNQVLTKSVVEALNEQYDLGLTKYNYGDGFRYLSGKGKSSYRIKAGKPKRITEDLKLPTIRIAAPKRYASRGISIGSNSGNSGGIKIGGFAPIKV